MSGTTSVDEAPVQLAGAAILDRAGEGLAGGLNLDGDGWIDLAVGSGWSDLGSTDAGAVFLVPGGPGL